MPFDSVGNLQSMRYCNGVTNLYQYDSRNRLTNLVWQSGSTQLASFAYTLGATGNRIALSETVNGNSQTYNWAYDYLYRLTGETFGGIAPQSVTYSFDLVGNRTNRTSTAFGLNNQSFAFTANDWLSNDTYDANGNTTVSATTNYQYDVLNHLTNVNNGAIVITYDGDGTRVSKKVGSTTTYYVVDDVNPSGYAQVLEEWTSTGTPTLSKVYNYGLALISQRQASGTVSYYGTDGHGNTRFLANTSGKITDTYTFDAYGLAIGSSGTTPNNYLYFGQQYDTDLGMYYLRARYYRPDSGRFWTMDTYDGDNEDPMSLHKYLYTENNPANKMDFNGHDGVDFFLSILGTIGTFLTPEPSSAPLKATGNGGPDVTLPVKRTLLDIESTFYQWTRTQRREAAEQMRDLEDAVIAKVLTGGDGGAAGAWDIIPLKNVGFQDVFFEDANNNEYPVGDDYTVIFNGKCYYGGALNYAMWGVMNKLCFDWFTLQGIAPEDDPYEYTLQNALTTARNWKQFKYKDFGGIERQAEAFTAFGYNYVAGSGGSINCQSLPYKPSGQVVPSEVLPWCWEPCKPREE